MSFVQIVVALFMLLELSNVLALYFAPGSKYANAVGVFTAWEASKRDPEIHDFVRYLGFMKCPLLVLVGSRSVETSMAFYTTPEALRGAGENHPHVQFELIDGADTNYTGCEQVPFERAAAWLAN